MSSSTNGTDCPRIALTEQKLLSMKRKAESEIQRWDEWRQRYLDWPVSKYINRDKEAFIEDCDAGIYAHKTAIELIDYFLAEYTDGRP